MSLIHPSASSLRLALAARIAELNDAFRTTLKGGRVMMTSGVGALPKATLGRIVHAIVSYDFSKPDPGNDPYGEHDFGCVDIDDAKVFWKIDYYDPSMEAGSEDPADPARTTRVLTIMLAEEN